MQAFYRATAVTLVVLLDLGLLALCLREEISVVAALSLMLAIGACVALARRLADVAEEERMITRYALSANVAIRR